MFWIGAFWHLVMLLADAGLTSLVELTTSPAELMTGSVTAALMLLAAVLLVRTLPRAEAAGPGQPSTLRALRQRISRVGVPRHRDPDAAGRARPRAPSTVLTVV